MISIRRFLINNPYQVFLVLLLLDGLMLLLHLLLGRQFICFHLDFEANLPTVYQSAKLILFGIFIFATSLTHKLNLEIKGFLIPLAIFITALGFDELLQIHEHIYLLFNLTTLLHPNVVVGVSLRYGYRSSLWILYYLPLILFFFAWIGYWLHYFRSRIRSNFLIILISTLSLTTALIMEIFSSTGSSTPQSYFWMITVEEVAEMLLASSLILVGIKMLRRLPHPTR